MKKKNRQDIPDTPEVEEAPPHPYSSLDLEEMREVVVDRDVHSQARIAHKASQIRDIALSDEEGRIALYLVVAEGSV